MDSNSYRSYRIRYGSWTNEFSKMLYFIDSLKYHDTLLLQIGPLMSICRKVGPNDKRYEIIQVCLTLG